MEPMALKRQPAEYPGHVRLVHQVTSVAFGESTSFADGMLTVSSDQAHQLVVDEALASVSVAWTSPGDSVRLIKILDAMEPRIVGPDVEGVAGPIHVVRGVAVVVAGYLPRAQEAIADMSGPAAELSPLGATHNLVIEFTKAPDASWEAVDEALRAGTLALASHLAGATIHAKPDEMEALPPTPDPALAASSLPAVGAITNLQTQGTFKDVFVDSVSFAGQAPAFIDPGSIDAGAVVSGQFGHPSLKNPTFVHQNHPVVAALRARHGVDLRFAGVIIAPEPVDAASKEEVSRHAARLAADAGLDAVIVTKEGGGNADGDMALKMDASEDLGLVAVGLFAEMAGPDGSGPPIVVPPERATAMVSTGNYDHRIALPAMERVLGGEELALLGMAAGEAMTLPLAVIYASLSPLGWGRLTCAPGAGPALAGADRPPAEAPVPTTTSSSPSAERTAGPIRVVHYLNQFFTGVGGEDAAGMAPTSVAGPVGPGRRLADLLGSDYEIVATVSCGDDYAAGTEGAVSEIVDLVAAADPHVVIAGPAFTSGRYGLACARLAAASVARGFPTVAAMHPDNPGLEEAGTAPVVASAEVARGMATSLPTLAGAVRALAAGSPVTEAEGRIGTLPRVTTMATRNAAERAVDLVLTRLGGDRDATEVPLPRFDRVTPAAAVSDLSNATLALVTEGGLVPDANPGSLESARATRWLRYRLEGADTLVPGEWRSVHGGFSTVWANAEPLRILPLDAARELEREGHIGRLLNEYFVTTGNGTSVGNARRFGIEWAADLRRSETRAAILTAT